MKYPSQPNFNLTKKKNIKLLNISWILSTRHIWSKHATLNNSKLFIRVILFFSNLRWTLSSINIVLWPFTNFGWVLSSFRSISRVKNFFYFITIKKNYIRFYKKLDISAGSVTFCFKREPNTSLMDYLQKMNTNHMILHELSTNAKEMLKILIQFLLVTRVRE